MDRPRSAGSPGAIVELERLAEQTAVFRDRSHAGTILADMLAPLRGSSTLVLAIPAGGVPVGQALASELGLELDVAVVSKITLPWNTEAGFGAVAFDGTVLLNQSLIRTLELSRRQVSEGIEHTRAKVARRLGQLRGSDVGPDVGGRRVLLVDDGLASGYTMLAAASAARRSGAAQLEVAVPTAHRSSADRVAAQVARLVCANLRGGASFAVASAYQHWRDVPEQEAAARLAAASTAP